MHAVRGGFDGGDAGATPCDLRIEARRFAQRLREDGAEAVDHVAGKQQWNAQPRLLHSDFLQRAGRRHAVHAEDRTHLPGADLCLAGGPGGRASLVAGSGRLVELAELFLERHAREQGFDEGSLAICLDMRHRRLLHGAESLGTQGKYEARQPRRHATAGATRCSRS